MAGGVDQIQLVLFALVFVIDGDGSCFDGNSAFPLNVQIVEQLFFELTLRDCSRFQQKLVGQRTFAVIDMGHNRKVTDMFVVHRGSVFVP